MIHANCKCVWKKQLCFSYIWSNYSQGFTGKLQNVFILIESQILRIRKTAYVVSSFCFNSTLGCNLKTLIALLDFSELALIRLWITSFIKEESSPSILPSVFIKSLILLNQFIGYIRYNNFGSSWTWLWRQMFKKIGGKIQSYISQADSGNSLAP